MEAAGTSTIARNGAAVRQKTAVESAIKELKVAPHRLVRQPLADPDGIVERQRHNLQLQVGERCRYQAVQQYGLFRHVESEGEGRGECPAAEFSSLCASPSAENQPTTDNAIAASDEAAVIAEAAQAAPLAPSAPTTPLYPADLTAREVEVLRLVAQGLTNPQIAAHLYISPRTVHAHLRAIYDKLEVTTRSAAARFAVEHGLG